MVVKYFFKGKYDEKWHRCQSEESCLRMASDGYEVKKVVFENREDNKPAAQPIRFYSIDA